MNLTPLAAQMASCGEASFYQQHCPDTKMDGDGDGVPAGVAERSLLFEVLPDGMQFRGINRFVQPRAVGRSAGLCVAPQGVEHRIGSLPEVGV